MVSELPELPELLVSLGIDLFWYVPHPEHVLVFIPAEVVVAGVVTTYSPYVCPVLLVTLSW